MANAVWFNKRAVSTLELPLPHSFTSHPHGWQIEFSTAGRIVARLREAGVQNIDVVAGDKLVSSAEELYLERSSSPSFNVGRTS